MRHALDGSVVEPVSDEHRHFAAERIAAMRDADRLKSKNDGESAEDEAAADDQGKGCASTTSIQAQRRPADAAPVARRFVMAKRFTRSSAKARLMPRQRAAERAIVGWTRPPIRARRHCPICWADLSDIPHCDWCPSCRKILMLGELA